MHNLHFPIHPAILMHHCGILIHSGVRFWMLGWPIGDKGDAGGNSIIAFHHAPHRQPEMRGNPEEHQ